MNEDLEVVVDPVNSLKKENLKDYDNMIGQEIINIFL